MNAPDLGTLVAVSWLDAHARAQAEQTLEDIAAETLVTYTSYGILVRCDTVVVAVAADARHDDGMRYRGVTYIPTGMVQSITSKQRKKRRPKPAPVETT